MSTITISRQYGSDGRTVGRKVAEILGYLYVDKELIVEVAGRIKVPVSAVAQFDEQPENVLLRTLKKMLVPQGNIGLYHMMDGDFWYPSTAMEFGLVAGEGEPILDEDTYVRTGQEVIMQLVHDSRVVLIGRGSQALLGFERDALHVRVVAAEPFRIRTVMDRDGLNFQAAEREIHRVDGLRQRFIKRHYGMEWDDPKHYHMVVNTGQTGVDAAAHLVADAAAEMLVHRDLLAH
jgi:cytidylate kinase